MKEVLAADRPEFSTAEEAGQRGPEFFGHEDRIVIRHGEQAPAASVASKQQSPRRLTFSQDSAQR